MIVFYSKAKDKSVFSSKRAADNKSEMSSEEFEKLHEIYRSLYEELKLMPERALKSQGGKKQKKQTNKQTTTTTKASLCCVLANKPNKMCYVL